MNKKNICFISSQEYAKYLEVTIVSILVNSNEEDNFHFHIIEDNISDNYKNDILKLKEIKDFELTYYKSPNVEKYKEWTQHCKEILGNKFVWIHNIFYKLDIPFLLKDIDKVLFLDIDQIVLTRLNKFFEFDLENNYIIYTPYPKHGCYHFAGEDIDRQYKELLKSLNLLPEEKYFLISNILVYNLKLIREKLTLKQMKYLIDEYFTKYKYMPGSDENIFPYVFRNNMLAVDQNLNRITSNDWQNIEWNSREIKIIHCHGYNLRSYLSYNYNKEINSAYVSFWEYFCQTPYYKNNYVEYSNIHMAHLRRWLLQEREERKWHIEDSRKYSKNNYNRLLNMILWIIPFKSIRDKLRNKYMIN